MGQSMNDRHKIKINPDYLVEKFDGEILMYSELGTKAVYLNDTAYGIWLLCQEEMTVGQIIDYLEQVYPGQKEQIREDVTTTLETLKSNDVIELCDAE